MPDSDTAKHTPGPWRVVPDEEETAAPWGRVEVAQFRYVTIEGRSKSEAYANARLIAAAPDLLEACKAVIDHSQNPFKNLDHILLKDVTENSDKWDEIHAMLRAAITKAVGENNQ